MTHRWALSYLRGPLTLHEIGRLTPARVASPADQAAPAARAAADAAPSTRPVLQAGVTERFVARRGRQTGDLPGAHRREGARAFRRCRGPHRHGSRGTTSRPAPATVRTGRKPMWSRTPGRVSPTAPPRMQPSARPRRRSRRHATTRLGRRARRPRLSHGHRQHVPLPGPEDGLRARRHGERVSRAPRAGLAGEARCGRRRAAQEVLVQAGRDRRSAAPRGTEDRATEVAGDQPDDGHRVVGGRQPARRAVRRASLECAATGFVRRARHRTRDQGTSDVRVPRRTRPRCTSSRTHSMRNSNPRSGTSNPNSTPRRSGSRRPQSRRRRATSPSMSWRSSGYP